MSSHASGPWFVYEVHGWSNNVANWAGHIATCENEEDAPLIAAAPDLLEELKELVEVFDGYQGMELTRAKAAIAKAEGQPQPRDEDAHASGA